MSKEALGKKMVMKKRVGKTIAKEVRGGGAKVELVLKKELPAIITEALGLKITSNAELKRVVEVLSRLNEMLDRIEEERKKVTEPLNQALKAENARWKPAKDKLSAAIAEVRAEMGRWQTEQTRIAKEAEEAAAAKVASGEMGVEEGVAVMGQIEVVEKKINAESGVVSFKKVQKVKIIDENTIPREYCQIDEKKILEALKAGVAVQGAILEEIQVPINYR